MKNAILILGLLMTAQLYAQAPSENDPFPTYTPFLDESDDASNFTHYYAVDSFFTFDPCNYNTDTCNQGTVQYNFTNGTVPKSEDDGNTFMDVYFSEDWDSTLAPNGKPLVMILHGINGNRFDSQGMVRRAIEMSKRGYVAVVPDYTTAGDSKWGAGSPFDQCLSKEQVQYIFYNSVREINAAIRRALQLSDGSSVYPKIDSSNVFLWGYSYGGITGLEMAFTDSSELPTPVDPVTFDGVDYPFHTALNDIPICPPGSSGCLSSVYSTGGYSVKNNIKGISSLSGFITDINNISDNDTIPLFLMHGTCDGIAPIDAPTLREAVYRRTAYRRLIDFDFMSEVPLSLVPCYDDANLYMDSIFYGTQVIWNHLKAKNNADSSYDPYRGIIRVCGTGHEINNRYGIKGDAVSNRAQIFEYETYRFFANILNNERKANFAFNLDQTKRMDLTDSIRLSNGDEVTIAESDYRACFAVPSWNKESQIDVARNNAVIFPKGDSDSTAIAFLSKFICPSCEPQAPQFERAIRYPYFTNNGSDAFRYDTIPGPPCPSLIVINEEDVDIYHKDVAATSVSILDHAGGFVKEIPLREEGDKMTKILIEDLDLEQGMYFLHFNNGEKQTLVIR